MYPFSQKGVKSILDCINNLYCTLKNFNLKSIMRITLDAVQSQFGFSFYCDLCKAQFLFFATLYARLLLKLNLFYIIFYAVKSELDPFTLFEKEAPQYVTILIMAEKKASKPEKPIKFLKYQKQKMTFYLFYSESCIINGEKE